MLLSITNTREPATDLGWLLHKHPDRTQSFPLAFGQAHVFYPEAGPDRCTACLLLDVDAVGLARQRRGPAGGNELLAQYVNDRPFVASSFLSVAVAQVFGSALSGNCKTKPELVEVPLPLRAKLTAVPCRRGGEAFLRKLFEPLGYAVTATRHPLDEQFPEWGEGPYFTVELAATVRVADLLSHLYVLVPVLDDEKHYWVGNDEVEKLLRHGEGWLADHPEKEAITARYLRRQGKLVKTALAQLTTDDGTDPDAAAAEQEAAEEQLEVKVHLHERRLAAVFEALKASGAKRVLDLGCSEGKLLRLLAAEPQFAEVVGLDVSVRALEIARLRLDRARVGDRVTLLHGALTYRDARTEGFDAAAVVEVVEHLDPPRLGAFERVLFGHTRPGVVVLTTPNREYNVKFETLPAGKLRHADHRFEWTRAEFAAWAAGVCERHGYACRIDPLGERRPRPRRPEPDGGVHPMNDPEQPAASWPTDDLVSFALSHPPTDEWDDPHWDAIRVLHLRGTREVFDAAEPLLAGACAFERAVGARILSQIGSPEQPFAVESNALLCRALAAETDEGVIVAALFALGHIRHADGVPTLLRFADHSGAEVRDAVAYALTPHDDRTEAALIRLTTDPDSDVRDWATFSLGTRTDRDTPRLRAALRARLTDPDDETRGEAMNGLASRRDPAAFDAILAELERPKPFVFAVEAAELLADPRLVPALEAASRRCGDEGGQLARAIEACRGGTVPD